MRVFVQVNRKKPRQCASVRSPSAYRESAPGHSASHHLAACSVPRLAFDSTSVRQKRRTSAVFCTDLPSAFS
jgi:hypothetical protein